MGIVTFRLHLILVVKHRHRNHYIHEGTEEWQFEDWRVADQWIERTIFEYLEPAQPYNVWTYNTYSNLTTYDEHYWQ